MYKLSHLDECWLVANIEKISGPIIFIFGLLPSITSESGSISNESISSSIGIIGGIAIVIGGINAHRIAKKVSKFASENFKEIISRRTKWKYSNVELHELKYKYVLKVYGYVLFSILIPIFSIVFLIGRSFHS